MKSFNYNQIGDTGVGKHSPSKLRWEAKQAQKEAELCYTDYARSILNAARSYRVFQYNPYSSAKPQRMAYALKEKGFLAIEKKIKPGWWNLIITQAGIDLLKQSNPINT